MTSKKNAIIKEGCKEKLHYNLIKISNKSLEEKDESTRNILKLMKNHVYSMNTRNTIINANIQELLIRLQI